MTLHDQRVKINGKLNATFSSRYLVTFSKAAHLSKTAHIKISNNQPILLKYEFGPESYISFFLAPKMNEDEDEDE
jgi:proliferating cell nuclear antigen